MVSFVDCARMILNGKFCKDFIGKDCKRTCIVYILWDVKGGMFHSTRLV